MKWYYALLIASSFVIALCGYMLWSVHQEEKRLREEKDPYDDLNSWEG